MLPAFQHPGPIPAPLSYLAPNRRTPALIPLLVTQLTGHVDPRVCGKYEAGVEVCATDFDAYMKANVLAPFGMKSSGYQATHAVARYAAMVACSPPPRTTRSS